MEDMKNNKMYWNLEEDVTDLCADLLSYKKYEDFIVQLTKRNSSSWSSLKELCVNLELPEHHENILTLLDGKLLVTYLPWPGCEDSLKDILVLFFNSDELWTNSAYYNLSAIKS